MALALNDMLKQQLLLTRGFVDMARQLYLSTVKSLESESYQYTTLEDTKKVKTRSSRMFSCLLVSDILGYFSDGPAFTYFYLAFALCLNGHTE